MNIGTEIGFSRRDALRAGAIGACSLPLLSKAESLPAKAKAVIQIWMWGGPAHLDTFDPKPMAGRDYCGPYSSSIRTNVDGIRICQKLPLLAAQGLAS